MIPGINMAGSYMHYQRQITAKDTTPSVAQAQLSSENNSVDYKVNLSNEKNKIEQEYSGKQASLEQEHEAKLKQLEAQYNREQSRIEQEYSIKKRSLNINIYA
ncbi:MAG: hypothetical protein HQK73_05620 [Desulfamplus sp.]|nr:hypothetical protein [Desulfamplus sp.]MBF0412497.1 hypothetical protein [Desulfamplus sp.]